MALPNGYGPADLASAYHVTSSGSSAMTVAIVDAYGYANAEADLATYRSMYGLPPCTTANGCFTKVDQNGGSSYPVYNAGWAGEQALDLDMVSAVCPNCKILLVQASSNYNSDLALAVSRAAQLGAHAISNSYGSTESSTQFSNFSSQYNIPGVAVTASSGDSGYGVEMPAAYAGVIAVGGTSLSRNSSVRGWTESAWSGAGSGCSAYVSKPSWQTDTGCARRTVADVSAIADPNTGVAVYGPFSGTSTGWAVYGGTSVAAPIIAALYGVNGGSVTAGQNPYGHADMLFDVASGSNGSCSPSYLCSGVAGYDGPTGLGSPNGTVAFGEQLSSSYQLDYTAAGAGNGTVNFSPPGSSASCTGSCANSYASGTNVTLTATPAAGSFFAGWSGNGICTGTSTCQIIMSAAQFVTATFFPSSSVTALSNGMPVGNLSASQGTGSYYSIDVPAGATNLSISSSGGTGDADLYVSFGTQPTTSSFACGPYLIGNNETCSFPKPSAGTYYILLNAYADYSGATILASYTAVGTPGISVSPTSGTFAGQSVNTTSAASNFTVTNTGNASLSITGITVSGPDAAAFAKSTTCATVAPSATCTISVTFTPTTAGAKTASLSIASNVTGSPTLVGLSGTGVTSPAVSLTPSSLTFASEALNTTSTASVVTLTNTGSANLVVSGVTVSGPDAAAFAPASTCATVAPSATCTISVTFTPTTAGAKTASLSIASNVTGSPTLVGLSGTVTVTTLSQFVGTIDGPGYADGTGAAARFNAPSGIAVDSSGTLYVTDTQSHLIRKISSGGVVTTLAGQALVPAAINSTGSAARFNKPSGIAIAGTTLYIADTENHLIRKLTTDGVASTLAGAAGSAGSINGTGTAAKFRRPQGVVTDSGGNVFVADTDNAVIRKSTSAGVVTTFAGTAGSTGGTNGTGAAARFSKPTGMGRDASNNLFVTDVVGQTIRKVTSLAAVTTFAGANGTVGSTNATGTAARFSAPSSAVVDSSGNIFIADAANSAIRKITAAGAVTTFAGTAGAQGSADATGAAARFYRPVGIARDASNNLYVADSVGQTIRKITTGGVVSTFAGVSAVVGANDNTGSAATFRSPSGVVADGNGNLFIADTGNHTIRKVTPTGVVSTFAGTALSAGSANATGTSARFNAPAGLAIDTAGNIYVADTGNHIIRKITPGGAVTTVAGTAGSSGSIDGTGAAARFKSPAALAVTKTGILYVADAGNYTIRKIVLSSGAVTTLAGTAGSKGTSEGTGTAARFGIVNGLGVDSGGNIYAADFSASTIRRITPTGITSTFAGAANSRGSTNATGTAARFSSPYGIAVDGSNNLYVSDYANCLIRKITSMAIVTTPIGTAGICKFTAGNAPTAINMPSALSKVGTTLYITVGNGVAQVSNVP